MPIIMTWLISHLLSELEALIIAEEPAIVEEIQDLIKKLEDFISNKFPVASEIVNPILEGASSLVDDSVPVIVHTIKQELETM